MTSAGIKDVGKNILSFGCNFITQRLLRLDEDSMKNNSIHRHSLFGFEVVHVRQANQTPFHFLWHLTYSQEMAGHH